MTAANIEMHTLYPELDMREIDMVIALDFDGTCTMEQLYPEIGEPRMWMIEKAKELRANGNTLILWTCRENSKERGYLDEAVAFCAQFGLEFDAVNQNPIEIKYPGVKTSRKIVADIYIDDKAAIFRDDIESLLMVNYK
jgi:trehalose-6-phosphatase